MAGWDCECGAKAMNSALWLRPHKPLMRGPQTTEVDAFAFGFNKSNGTAELSDSIREMICLPF